MLQKESLKKFLINFLKFFGFLLIVFLVFLLILFLSENLKIKEIQIIDYQSKILGLDEIKNNFLFFLDEEKVKKIIKKRNPLVKEVIIEKKFPNKLILKLTQEKFIAILAVDSGYFYLNDEGKILLKTKKINEILPKINFYQKLSFDSYSVGEKIDFNDILTGIYFLKNLLDINLKPDNLDIIGADVLVFNIGEKKFYFSTIKNREVQLYQLNQIVKQFKIEGRAYKEIDLRFDKPIVRF